MAAATSTFWCERAWLGPDAADHGDGVLVTVTAGMITAVAAGVDAPPPGATALRGLTLPGFANAHSHAFHRALRGRTHTGGTFWTWRAQMYALAATLDPDAYERLATAVFGEMLLAGYTVVGEFHYLHHQPGGVPYSDANEIGRRLLSAADTAGVRITLLDTCYLHGGFGVAPNAVQRRFSDGTAAAWVARVAELADAASDCARLGAAVHSVRAVDPEAIAEVAAWAREHGAVIHAHVSEQPQENADCLAAHGCTPVELLERHAGIDERFCAVHATHVTSRDVDLLAAGGAVCCICPTTERDLADGIGPTAALGTARLCLGSDSHAVIDPFEEVRAVELDERLASGQRGTHDPAALLRAATVEGYRALGWNGGTIAPGRLADLVTIGLDSVRLAGHDRADPAASVVFAATAADVRHVVVGGEHVVRDGVHRALDVAPELERSVTDAWSAA